MTFDPALSAMMAEPWSNNACRGYVIYAMENCGFSSEDIRRVVGELHYIFDFKTLEEAKHHYENGPTAFGQIGYRVQGRSGET